MGMKIKVEESGERRRALYFEMFPSLLDMLDGVSTSPVN
jgi:hypothetical protein